MCHIYVVISAIICRKWLVTLMNSFQRWGLSYALGGKSAEYVFSFMKLMWHQPKICHDQVPATFLFRHTRYVSDSLLTPRLLDNIFHKLFIRRSYVHFSQVQVTFPHSRRKIKKVRWFLSRWLVTSLNVFIWSTRYFVTPQMFQPRPARVTPAYPWWCRGKYYKF
jgi:hypothetical protein